MHIWDDKYMARLFSIIIWSYLGCMYVLVYAPLYYIIMYIWDDKYMAWLLSIIICYLVCTNVLVYARCMCINLHVWDTD